MEWIQMPLGPIQTNCYVLMKEDSTCLIVDPGNEGEKLIGVLRERNLQPTAIVLTHAHYDHIGAVDSIRDEYNIPAYVHVNEKEWLSSPSLNLGQVIARDPDFTFSGEQELTLGSFTFQLFETPGHSPGSVSLYFKDAGLVLVGDALFNGSIGRTDLPGCNHQDLMNSLREKILTLPEDTTVLPGHGPITTIGKEIDSNPFLNGF
ncbi:MBL fold metallo-hydrolase [Niallia endozanthoxylica]|uniref:MBL fold metallo-hydrolase n=1 Tax=Niallia endozanthoxylica TaxID=2036016 RepID=A0A5J5HZ17_9BACI|nr:MBL fold metallo-hydrolase [Niallia endozanthoxylica]KAA9026284.1 MBL fold metallo-hydrolase [Niallia endozanthoxylica]